MTSHVRIRDITLDEVVRFAVDGLFIINRSREVVFFSEGCERLTGADRTSVLGTPCVCHQLTQCRDEHGRLLSDELCPSLKIFDGEIPSYRQRMNIRQDNGARLWVETTYSPIRDGMGQVIEVVGIMRDITEVKEREDELREAAERHGAYPPDETARVGEASKTVPEDGDESTQASDKMGPLDWVLTSLERREILTALKRTNGQRTLAARLLGISRSRLYRRMEVLGIDPRRISPRGDD